MFTDRVTLQDATPADEHFDARSSTSSSTTRAVAAQPLDEPKLLHIAHNKVNAGERIDTVVYIDRTVQDADEVTYGTSRAQFTLRYNPGQITAADVQEDVEELKEFLSTANITKLLNLEH